MSNAADENEGNYYPLHRSPAVPVPSMVVPFIWTALLLTMMELETSTETLKLLTPACHVPLDTDTGVVTVLTPTLFVTDWIILVLE